MVIITTIQNIQPGDKTKRDYSLYQLIIKLMEVLKEVLGVDVAQKELVVTLGRLKSDLSTELYLRRVFANKETGFAALLKWLQKNSGIKASVVMEATGVYHQKFAYFLDDNGIDLSIILPNKISNYQRTLEVKTITDQTCADAIAHFGLGRRLENWKRPDTTYRTLQQLTRERDQIVEQRVMIKNQIHAESAEAFPNDNSLKRLEKRRRLLNQQEKEIKLELGQILKQNPQVKEKADRLCSIPGVGVLTAVTILGETNGFELIRSKKQLTSYAGLDVREKQSGTSIKGKPRISKRGNRHLRSAMHFPAICAVKKEGEYRDLYARIVAKNGIKMKGLVAVQRKLLELCYILFKTDKDFDPTYEQRKREQSLGQVSLTS